MKITCPSCSARYSIDDAKVKGKAFKFTCKKCGQTHVYRGSADGSATAVPAGGAPAGAAPAAQAPAPAPAGGEEEAVWYVAVGEEQQGPYTTQQIREYIQTDQLDPESFMWKEGMEDWLPVQQIQEFGDVYQGGAPAGGAPAPSPASAFSGPAADEVTVASPFSPAALPPTDSGDLFAFGGSPAPASAGKAAAPRSADPSPFGAFGGGGSAAVAQRGGADLFGAPAQASPFEAGGEEREEDVMMGAAAAAAPSPRVDARQMIGQRNENSVLFSLSSLQSLGAGKAAAAPSAGAHAAPAKAGFASGEGSGLIDIKAMAGSITKQEERHDDMFALGGGAIGAPVAVPILTRPIRHEEESKKPMYILIGVIGTFAIAIVVLLVFLLGKKEETKTPPPTVVAVAPADAGGVVMTPEELERLKAEAAAEALANQDVGSTKEQDAGAGDAGTAGDVGAGDGDPNAKAADGGDGGPVDPEGLRNPGTRRDSGTRRDEDAGPGTTTSTTRDSGSSTSRADASRVAGSLEGLGIRRDAGSSSTQTSGLPATPSRDDVRSKFESVRGAVRACTANQAGTASVATTIQGSSGRVTRVNVTGDFTGPAATCVNNAIRGLVFPQFSNASLTVNYSYRF